MPSTPKASQLQSVLLPNRSGLTLSKISTYSLQVAAGKCVVQDSAGNLDVAELESAMTKILNVGWSSGPGNGALDTGTLSNNQTYHIHAILNQGSGTKDWIASLSPTSPTLPTGYTYSSRIGSILIRSNAILDFTQYGDTFKWASPQRDLDGVEVPLDGTLYSLTVPTGFPVEAIATVSSGYGSPGALNIIVSDPAQADIAPNSSAVWLGTFNSTVGGSDNGSSGAIATVSEIRRFTNASAEWRFRRSGTYAGSTFRTTCQTLGFRDPTIGGGGSAGSGGGGSGTGDVSSTVSSAIANQVAVAADTSGKSLLFRPLTVDSAGNLATSGSIDIASPLSVGTYTVGTLPSAATWSDFEATVTDANGGTRTKVISNGTNWIDVRTGLPVSTAVINRMQELILLANSGFAPTSTTAARQDARNGQPVLAFDAATAWFWEWLIRLPSNYNGNGLTVEILWTSATAGSGDVIWNGAFSRVQTGTTDLSAAPTYATAQAVTSAAPGTTGVATRATITFSNSQINSAVAGEDIKFRLSRDAANVSDSLNGIEAQVFSVVVKGA